MKRLDHLKFNVKVQVIYYQTQSDDLGIEFAQSPKRITLNEAKDILDSRGLLYDEVLRVKYENHDIKLTSEEFEKLLTI